MTQHPLTQELIQLDRTHVWHPFTQEATAPPPIPIVSARGAWLYGADGRRYLDLISSWWVSVHGHGHPVIANAIARQAHELEQVIFAGFTHEPAVRLAQRLSHQLPAGLSRVFFSDNGSTSVEVALKIAIQYHRNQGGERHRIAILDGGYHGDTMGAMAVGRSSGFFNTFTDYLFQVDTLPFPATWDGDDSVEEKEKAALAALDRHLEAHGSELAAIILEPLVQGASGMRMCRPVFLQALAHRIRQTGGLIIFDEVMTGFGRTGTLFACEKAGVTPDIICLSKGLTGGFMPMAVTVCRQELHAAFLGDTFDRALAHGHSFTANPLGCAAALASLDLFDTGEPLNQCATLEALHRERLQELSTHPRVAKPRVTGVIAALNMVIPGHSGYTAAIGQSLKPFFLTRGLLIRPLGEVIYLLPPYCLTREELNIAWDAIADALNTVV
ncbi:MAG: adenosylmethionine--8-amino-7-oxononanoate transaminase [Magnetococcales bacterium]|nr:adenosylmethionine--8-amino-7-oxononanoate transaminase [Magnetococcales bacterium]